VKSLLPGALAALALHCAGAAQATPVFWDPASGGNGHWYELSAGTADFAGARAGAAALTHLGTEGHLATVTSLAEHQFMTAALSLAPNVPLWLAGSDAGTEGVWKWVEGPEAGDIFFGPGAAPGAFSLWHAPSSEPNGGLRENALHAWALAGEWNDAPAGLTGYRYVIEYSMEAAPVPLPAAAGLLAAGIGGLALMRRRRKR
jgi:hypothetical protein